MYIRLSLACHRFDLQIKITRLLKRKKNTNLEKYLEKSKKNESQKYE
jgi:hypothetical protein